MKTIKERIYSWSDRTHAVLDYLAHAICAVLFCGGIITLMLSTTKIIDTEFAGIAVVLLFVSIFLYILWEEIDEIWYYGK